MKMKIEMDVTVPQAVTLREMFNYWNRLAGIGSSRYVAFYVDGDGNFHPHVTMSFSEELPELTKDELGHAVVEPRAYDVREGDRFYDFDPIEWILHGERNKESQP